MATAIRLAEKGRYTTDPNPRVGCVLTRDNVPVAGGWHQAAGAPHAEIIALTELEQAVGTVCYLTLEPCCHYGRTPACVESLIKAGVERVIAAMIDPNPEVCGRGLQRLNDAGIETESGLMEQQAKALNPGFISRMETGLPYVRCKLAMSMDAKTALANGISRWISSRQSRADVHRWRAASSAVVTGIGTVLADDPLMTVRDFKRPFLPPLQVIIDPRLRTPVDAKILTSQARTLIFTRSDDDQRRRALIDRRAEVISPEHDDAQPWLKAVLRHLGERQGVNEVLIEAGASLSGGFIANGLVDELIIYMSPKLMGHGARSLLELPQFEQLSDCPQLTILDVRHIGNDIRIHAGIDKN